MLGEKLKEALSKKENDINTFVWKGDKKRDANGNVVQEEYKMVDCTAEQLNHFYKVCETMLYNNSDPKNLGRWNVIAEIEDQRSRCNTELFLRWLEREGTPRYTFNIALRNFLNNNPSVDPKTESIKVAVGGCPKEYEDLNIDMVLDGCIDALGILNKQHITLKFILRQGIWFSAEEAKKLAQEGVTDRLEYVRKYLGLKTAPELKINPKGMTLDQMFSMVSLRARKYSEMTNTQLKVLNNRILFALENSVRFHIKQWEQRKEQITKICEVKGYKLSK